jgi:hypothetical protein
MVPDAGVLGSARSSWAATRVHVWPERYFLVRLPRGAESVAAAAIARAGAFSALVVERDEVSLTIAEEAWNAAGQTSLAQAGPYRAITLDIDLDLGVVGYLAPAAARLAAAGISIVPQCAYSKDHLLVRDADLPAAVAILEQLAREARA